MVLKIHQVAPWAGDLPFVSVIIPCYNHGQYLDDAVQSILHQTWQNFEIIVVNDGSNVESTVEILKGFHMPKTRVLHLPENMGLPAARNAGIQEAKGKYICCLDADDKLHPTYKEYLFEKIKENNPAIYIYPKEAIEKIKKGYCDIYIPQASGTSFSYDLGGKARTG